ncbi:hypothetical protein OIV83_001159 [Microbotryomycetes sp. JL201]|nr:hypothetical protein OIV83_001159 [Microbotryomycetes sp. JL201]
MVSIKAGQFICDYRGEARSYASGVFFVIGLNGSPRQVIHRDEAYRRVKRDYKHVSSYYFLDYDGYDVLDAGKKGNAARFINHSIDDDVGSTKKRKLKVQFKSPDKEKPSSVAPPLRYLDGRSAIKVAANIKKTPLARRPKDLEAVGAESKLAKALGKKGKKPKGRPLKLGVRTKSVKGPTRRKRPTGPRKLAKHRSTTAENWTGNSPNRHNPA